MKEKTLLKISLICALVGLYALFLINERISVDSKTIAEINSTLLEKDISVRGEITRVTQTDGLYLINIKDKSNKEITIVVFRDQELELKKGNIVNVEGTIKDYKGNLEILAKKIELY